MITIKPGCIVCGICEDLAPLLFDVQTETCVVRPGAEEATHADPGATDAERECPVEVIVVTGDEDLVF